MKLPALFIILLFAASTVNYTAKAQTPILWGMTNYPGGANGEGNIFSVTASGTLTSEYSFKSGTFDGQSPVGKLLQAHDGKLYGLTSIGGTYDTGGVIFSYNISKGIETLEYSFGNNNGGTDPLGSLIQASNGKLYGLTYKGNGNANHGEIFSFNGFETDLYHFAFGIDGQNPAGSLLQASNGLLYKLTTGGGNYGGGIIFTYDTSTGVEKDVYDLGSVLTDAHHCYGSFIQVGDSLLYALSLYGGIYGNSNGGGALFSFNIYTDSEKVLYSFDSGTDGGYPVGSLVKAGNGLLYGMTVSGGKNSVGIIFSYNISTGVETDLHDFGGTGDGSYPPGSLIQASDSLLYGTTSSGGAHNYGTVFSYNITTGKETVITNFSGTDGAFPVGDLIEVDTPAVTTGVNQLSVNSNQLSVYPNPASDFIYVNLLQQTQPVQLSLYTILGQEVYSAPANANSTATIEVTNLPDGVYVLKTNEGGTFEQKEIIVAR